MLLTMTPRRLLMTPPRHLPGASGAGAVSVVRREEIPRMLSSMAGHPRRWLTYGSDTERLLSISCVLRTLASEPRMPA